jgi:hypothetical protein
LGSNQQRSVEYINGGWDPTGKEGLNSHIKGSWDPTSKEGLGYG